MPTGRLARGILDQDDNAAKLLGNQLVCDPGSTSVAGLNIVKKDFPVFVTSSDVEANPYMTTIAVDAFPQVVAAGEEEQVLLQGVLKFSTGASQVGASGSAELTLIGQTATNNAEVIFDLVRGAVVTVPASQVDFRIRYTAVKRSAPFTVGLQIGPIFLVNASMGMGDHNKILQLTKTDPMITLAHTASALFVPPPYAQAVSFSWQQYKTAKPLLVQQLTWKAASLGDFIIDPSVAATPFIPPPIIPLNGSTAGVMVTNQDAVNDMSQFTATWYLVL